MLPILKDLLLGSFFHFFSFFVAIAPSFDLAVACNLSAAGHAHLHCGSPRARRLPSSNRDAAFFRSATAFSGARRRVGSGASAISRSVFRDYILSGFRVRFRVGFDYSSARLSQARRNLSSAREHAAVVDSYIALESLHHRRLCGPIRGRPSAWESTSARLA